MLESLAALAALACMGLAAFWLGRQLLRAVIRDELDPFADVAFSLAMGWVSWGLLLAGLGCAGWLYQPFIVLLTAAGSVAGVWEVWRLMRRNTRAPRSPVVERPGSAWVYRGLLALTVIAATGSLIHALAPPTAGDALCYHLELPKQFLLAHRLTFDPNSPNCTFPLLAEMWFLWGLAVQGATSAQLVHWFMGVQLALAAVVLVRPIAGDTIARWTGALVLLVPAINNEMTAPLNDVALAVLATTALAALLRASAPNGDRRWFVVAGWLLGGALGVKYLALVWSAAAVAAFAILGFQQPALRKRLIWGALVVATVAASVGGGWYARALWYRGNPVYPFFDELVTGRPNTTLPESKAQLGRSPIAFATAPWQLAMHPERYGGRAHQLGPFLLMLVPLAGLSSISLRRAATLLLLAGAYAVLWFLLRQNERFLLPIVPLLCAVAAIGMAQLARFPRWPRALATVAVAIVLTGMAAIPVARARTTLPVVIGAQSRQSYLALHEPTLLASRAVARLEKQAVVLSQEQRLFYFARPVVRESVYRARTGYDSALGAPAQYSAELRARGFSHLLLVDADGTGGVRYDSTLSELADAASAANPSSMRSLCEYTFRDSDGARRRYRLIELR